MSTAVTSDTPAARLTLPTGDVLSVTVGGAWACDEPVLAGLYNQLFSPSALTLQFAVGGGAALAQVAAEERGGTVEVLHTPDALPAGAIY